MALLLLACGGLLLAGLATGSERVLSAGIGLLIAVPVARTLAVAVDLASARDWAFAGLALLVVALLAGSAFLTPRQ